MGEVNALNNSAAYIQEMTVNDCCGVFYLAFLWYEDHYLTVQVQKEIRKAVSKCQTQTEGNNFNMVTQDFTAWTRNI